MYVNLGYDRFASDSSTSPWTNASVTFFSMPQLPVGSPTLYASEHWGAFVDSNDNGLTVFVPGMAPYMGGFVAAIGYHFALDTHAYATGTHTIQVRAVDASGNVAVFPGVSVNVQN